MIDSHPDPSAVPALNQRAFAARQFARAVGSEPSARRTLESRLLRRDRHAHRRGRHVALQRLADRPVGARAALLDDPAQGPRPLSCSSRPWSGSGSRSTTRPFSPSRWQWTAGATIGSSPSGRMSTTSCGSAPSNPLRFERDRTGGVKPYVRVRGDLWARVTRPLAVDLVGLGEVREIDGLAMFGIVAGGGFFPIAPPPSSKAANEASAPRHAAICHGRRRRLRAEPPRVDDALANPRGDHSLAGRALPCAVRAEASCGPGAGRHARRRARRALHRARLRPARAFRSDRLSGRARRPAGRLATRGRVPGGGGGDRARSFVRLARSAISTPISLRRTTSSCRSSASYPLPIRLTLNPREVAAAFEVPLGFLMDPAHHQLHSREWQGRLRRYYAIPYGERYIWGVTAGIVRNLYERLYGP